MKFWNSTIYQLVGSQIPNVDGAWTQPLVEDGKVMVKPCTGELGCNSGGGEFTSWYDIIGLLRNKAERVSIQTMGIVDSC